MINAAIGEDQFHVVVVGGEDTNDRVASIQAQHGTLSYSKVDAAVPDIAGIAPVNADQGGQVRITGISKEGSSLTSDMSRICSELEAMPGREGKLVLADTFGKALAIAITSEAAIMNALDVSKQAKDKLRKAVRDEKGVISLTGTASQDTEEAIDNYIFGELEAETAF